MLWVLPCCAKDIQLAQLNIRLMKYWDDSALYQHDDRRHRLLVATPRGLECDELLCAAAEVFHDIETFVYDDWAGEPSWPQPQNWAWQETARYLTNHDTAGKGWFWWEPDVTPIAPDWREKLEDEYSKCGRRYMGAIVWGINGHMNGAGIYPKDVANDATAPFTTRNIPFDITLYKHIGRNNIHHTTLIHHIPRPTNITLRFSKRPVVKKIAKEGAVLIHGCNDGSLPELLLGIRKPRKNDGVVWDYATKDIGLTKDQAVTFHLYDQSRLKKDGWMFQELEETQREVAPLREQTPYPFGIFNLPLTKLICHFNATIIRHVDGKPYVIARKWDRPNESFGNWTSTLIRCRVDLETMRLSDPKLLFNRKLEHGEQREDPRACIWNNHTLIGFVQWFKQGKYIAHQAVSFFDDQWNMKHTMDVPYGGNSKSNRDGKAHEKNWLWFSGRDNGLKMVYQFHPHTVVDVDVRSGMSSSVSKTPSPADKWKYGEIRGGTPPVLVGDRYFSFFHSSLWWKNKQKRYYMGAYSFDAAPPYRVTGITREPLLIGSENDSRTLGGPLCVFPCGAICEDGHWIVTMGVNDEQCGWIKIPHGDIQEKMSAV